MLCIEWMAVWMNEWINGWLFKMQNQIKDGISFEWKSKWVNKLKDDGVIQIMNKQR